MEQRRLVSHMAGGSGAAAGGGQVPPGDPGDTAAFLRQVPRARDGARHPAKERQCPVSG